MKIDECKITYGGLRPVYYIDIGEMSPEKAIEYLNKVREQLKEEKAKAKNG